jgi:very-short-patch-repair endonuclease
MPRLSLRRHPVPAKHADVGVHQARHDASAVTLWEHLRERRCDGFHFQRQASVDGAVADFYCAAAKLAVQVVGAARVADQPEVTRNEQALAAFGLRVLRVPAATVARDPRVAARLVSDALMECGHAPGPAKVSKHHFGPGPVGDVW